MRTGSVPVVAPSRALFSRQAQIMALIAKPPQQPALAGQFQPARTGPLGKLALQLLIGRGQLHGLLAPDSSSRQSLVSPPSPELHR